MSETAVQTRLAVVVTFDRLPLRLLGCYGSQLCQMPQLDRLASEGCVLHGHYVADCGETDGLADWWGNGAALRAAGVAARLVTDVPQAGHAAEQGGWEVERLPSGEDDGRLARLLERGAEWLEREASGPRVLWLHASGLPEIPVPPLEFLELYLDELVAPEEMDEPDGTTPADLDEVQREEALERIEATLAVLSDEEAELGLEELQVLSVLAAASLSAIDRELGLFFDRIRSVVPEADLLVMLSAARGLGLGEEVVTKRLQNAAAAGPLQEEIVHVPLVVKPGCVAAPRHLTALTQPADLPATIADWLGCSTDAATGRSLLPLTSGEAEGVRQFAVSRAGEWRAIRDAEWLLVCQRELGIERLYTRPDDRWQVLDLAAHNLDEVDRLLAELATREQPSGGES